jgi:beta-lactamase class C
MDMGKWLIARLGHYPQVLSAGMLDDIHQKRIKTSDNLSGRTFGPYVTTAHYGLGTRIYQFGKHTLYYHGGLVRGYRTDMSYSADKGIGLAVLLNGQSNLVAELSSYFWANMLDTKPQVPANPKRKKALRQVAEQLTPLFTPSPTEMTAALAEDWMIPYQLDTQWSETSWSEDDLQQLANLAYQQLLAAP